MVEGKLLIIVLYVDDLILTSDDQLIQSWKEDLAREFEMKDMGLMHYFLGMEVWQKDGEVFVSKGKYANEILKRFHMDKCKPMQTPLADRGSEASGLHRCILGKESIRSEEHFWRNLQPWFSCSFLVQQETERMDPTVIYCGNQSCIKLSQNPVFHDRSKHIDILYHHLRDCVVKRIMLLLYVSTEEQDVDILNKALSKCKFEFHRDRIAVTNNPFLVEREC
eukprot:PITA_19107